MKYKKHLSCKHSEKEEDLKNAVVILHGRDDVHFISILSLLATMFTREFYIRLNKWDKGRQSLPDTIATTAVLLINEGMPDKSTPEGKEIAERLYHVAGWILTSRRGKSIHIL